MEGIQEMKNLGKGTGSTDAIITKRIQEMDHRISGTEYMIDHIDSSIKEYF